MISSLMTTMMSPWVTRNGRAVGPHYSDLMRPATTLTMALLLVGIFVAGIVSLLRL